MPSIAFADPGDPAPLDAALRALDGFEWAIFTSATAVDRTAARLRALEVDVAALARLRLAAVGPATAERLARIVREPDLVPGEAKGDVLARALAPHVRGRRCSSLVPPTGAPRRWRGCSPPERS